MANVDAAFGFQPVEKLDGSAWNGKINWYFVPASITSAIFHGDMVTLTGTADTSGIYPSITVAAAGSSLLGSAIAFRRDAPEGATANLAGSTTIFRDEYSAASVAGYVGVVDDPSVVYIAQVNGTQAAAGTGGVCDITAGAGSTSTFTSAHEIDYSSLLTSAGSTGQIRLFGLNNLADGSNEIGADAVVRCIINEHQFTTARGV